MGLQFRLSHALGEQTFAFSVEQGNQPILVGRAGSSAVQVPSLSVSPAHCGFAWRNGRWYVQDAGSRNGTLLNGRPLEKATAVKALDVITLGDEPHPPTIVIEHAQDDAPPPLPHTDYVAAAADSQMEPTIEGVGGFDTVDPELQAAVGGGGTRRRRKRGAGWGTLLVTALVMIGLVAGGLYVLRKAAPPGSPGDRLLTAIGLGKGEAAPAEPPEPPANPTETPATTQAVSPDVGDGTMFETNPTPEPAPEPGPAPAPSPSPEPALPPVPEIPDVIDAVADGGNGGGGSGGGEVLNGVPPTSPLRQEQAWQQVEFSRRTDPPETNVYQYLQYKARTAPNPLHDVVDRWTEEALDRLWWRRIRELTTEEQVVFDDLAEIERQLRLLPTDASPDERNRMIRERDELRARSAELDRLLTNELGYGEGVVPNLDDEALLNQLRARRDSGKYEAWKAKALSTIRRTRGQAAY